MDVIRYPVDARPAGWRSPVLALGNFDGLHLGHMSIVRRVVARARELDSSPVLLTFDPHPTRVTRPDRTPRLLMTTAQKIDAVAGSGLAGMVIVEFTNAFSHWEPGHFVERVLVTWLGISEVFVGGNFLFGRDRSGDFRTLQALGTQHGFAATKVDAVVAGGLPVSSTRIRDLVSAGLVGEAAPLLGRHFAIDGRVVRGDGRGRALGFPTANLETDNELLPRRGVYVTRAAVDGHVYPSVTNIGVHPTVGAASGDLVEVHLLEGGRDLYGAAVRLAFVDRVRDERVFPSIDALRAQIADDCAAALARLSIA